MLRRVALACLVCVAVSAGMSPMAIGDDTAPAAPSSPLSSRIIKGGIQQDENAESTLAAEQNWELQARTLAAEEDEAQIGKFINDPLVSRVTSVGEIDKTSGLQKITAQPIRSVTVSADGSVDIGQLVDGSGAELWIPPGSLAKGDLFTKIVNQYVKVPPNHFDAMGSLADQVNKQVPFDSPTALNQLANQLANAADAYASNAARFANDFLTGATAAIGNTLNFLAQQRGDFGQPGKPLQDIWNYLNNDYNQNDQALRAAAEQAVANHPGSALGSNILAFVPLGQLGKEAEIAQVSQAAQRLTALENTASEFANMERGVVDDLENGPPFAAGGANYPTVPGNAALQHARYPAGGPAVPKFWQPGRTPTAPLNSSGTPSGISPAAAGGVDNTVPVGAGGDPAAAPPPSLSGGGGIAPPTPPAPEDAPTVQTPAVASGAPPIGSNPSSPLQSRIIRTAQGDAAKHTKTGPVTPEQREQIRDSVKKLQTALEQDDQWHALGGAQGAGGATAVARSSAASSAPTPARDPDIISTLESRFGNTPKDPLQGAPGLQESHFGIPTPATGASIINALTIAGDHSQGLVFSPGTAGSVNILNARNNDGQIEFLDPSSEKRAEPPANSPLYFYRTQ